MICRSFFQITILLFQAFLYIAQEKRQWRKIAIGASQRFLQQAPDCQVNANVPPRKRPGALTTAGD